MMSWVEFQGVVWETFIKRDEVYERSLEDCVEILNNIVNDKIVNVDKSLYDKTSKQISPNVIMTILKNELFDKLREIASNYYKGNIQSAIEGMKNLLFSETTGSNFLPIDNTLVKRRAIFYRMRKNDKYDLYDRTEMFHIPLNKRCNISSQRYSINGFPCLYLGTSLYDCWEETRRPDLDKVNYVALKYVRHKELRLLDIGKRLEIKTIDQLKSVMLSILCSMKVKEEEDSKSFKKEYVFPELILHSLIDYNNEAKEANKYDGIVYLSARYYYDRCEYRSSSIMKNVILPTSATTGEFCPKLTQMFTISKTHALFMERIYGRSFCGIKARPTKYTGSLFHSIEEDLKSSETFEKID